MHDARPAMGEQVFPTLRAVGKSELFKQETGMNYYKKAIQAQWMAVKCMAIALWRTLKAMFGLYPNLTWAGICAGLMVAAIVEIGKARAEADTYGHENWLLQHQLDSLQGKEIKYTHLEMKN